MLTIIGSILGTVGSLTQKLALISLAIDIIKAIGSIFMELGKALGLIEPEEKLEDLGDRALQAEGEIDLEDYNSFAEYVAALEKFELNPEKSKEISIEDKIKKGMELSIALLMEKYPSMPIESFCLEIANNTNFFTVDRLQKVGDLISEDMNQIEGLLKYMNGSEKNVNKLLEIEDKLIAIEKTLNPHASDIEILRDVKSIRNI